MWVVYAFAAAVLWGASYTMYSVLIRHLPPAAAMIFVTACNLALYLVIAAARGEVGSGVAIARAQPALLVIVAGASLAAAFAMLLMLHAMKASNATLAALIEISYPLFIALFSWVFLRESQMNLGTALGAAMILSGIGCIYYFNKTV